MVMFIGEAEVQKCLIRHRERVASKDELINAVWSGRIASDAALTTRLNAVGCAIGDTGEKQRLIKTLPRKGFRFVGTVREAERPAVEPVSSADRDDTSAAPAPRPSIFVLPFANLSGNPEQDYFVDWCDREPGYRPVAVRGYNTSPIWNGRGCTRPCRHPSEPRLGIAVLAWVNSRYRSANVE